MTPSLKAHIEALIHPEPSHEDHHDEWLALLADWEAEQQS